MGIGEQKGTILGFCFFPSSHLLSLRCSGLLLFITTTVFEFGYGWEKKRKVFGDLREHLSYMLTRSS